MACLDARPTLLTTSRKLKTGVPSAAVDSPHMTKNFVSLKMKTSSRHVTAAMICSPSPGVRSRKLRPRTGVPAPSVSHTSGAPGLEKNTREGVDAVPPGPALVWVPNAVATSRLAAFVPDVEPGTTAVTATDPAFGIALAAVPLTVAVGAVHAVPSQRCSVSTPFPAYRYSWVGSANRA